MSHLPLDFMDREALKRRVKELEGKLQEAHVLTQRLLNKVNRVTARHRHGQPVLDGDLWELSERQIDIERALAKSECRLCPTGLCSAHQTPAAPTAEQEAAKVLQETRERQAFNAELAKLGVLAPLPRKERSR